MAFHVPQRGRPQATEGTKRIILRESTFRLWNERKERLNIKGLSNSQFAEILLHQNIEELRARSSSCQESQESAAETSINNGPSSSRRELFQSTPLSKRARMEIDVSPVVPGRNEEDTNTLVDVTGESVVLDPKRDDALAQEISVSAVSLEKSMATLNPAFGSLGGDPFVDDSQNCEVLEHFFHSLDAWHKSVKLTAKLSAASKIKGCEALAQWIEPIRNHFWHCAETCDGDLTKLKEMWIGVIHHVCGEHEWENGECSHGQLTEVEEGKEILAKDSKAAEELRKIVFDAEWLKSLQYYVKFRHTSKLENFNSMLLKYASKRIAFSYEVFTGRCLLAVLDHNFHLFRKTIDGKFKKLYSKRSGNWRAEAVKEDKSYSYWPALIAEILCKRAEDQETAARHVTVSPTNPQHLAPTIAMRESPTTENLVAARLSRFKQQTQNS